MAKAATPWHICDDCLKPMADALLAISRRCGVTFDIEKHDQLASESWAIDESTGFNASLLTDQQRKRLDEISTWMNAQTEPATSGDVRSVYKEFKVDLATDWLKFNISVDFGDDFNRKLINARKRFAVLEFKACQIINDDECSTSTTGVQYGIERLIRRHEQLLRTAFPNDDNRPDRDEMPEVMRRIEDEILGEYIDVQHEFRDVTAYLRRVAAMVRAKMEQKPSVRQSVSSTQPIDDGQLNEIDALAEDLYQRLSAAKGTNRKPAVCRVVGNLMDRIQFHDWSEWAPKHNWPIDDRRLDSFTSDVAAALKNVMEHSVTVLRTSGTTVPSQLVDCMRAYLRLRDVSIGPPPGKPGAPKKYQDISNFMLKQKKKMPQPTLKESIALWQQQNPDDPRLVGKTHQQLENIFKGALKRQKKKMGT